MCHPNLGPNRRCRIYRSLPVQSWQCGLAIYGLVWRVSGGQSQAIGKGTEGTDGNPRQPAKTRAAIRQLLEDEKIQLVPDCKAGHLVAEFGLNRFALPRAARASRDLGSGGAITNDGLPEIPLRRKTS